MSQENKKFEFAILRIQDCGFLIEESIEPLDNDMQVGYAMNHMVDINHNTIHFVLKAVFSRTGSLKPMAENSVLTSFLVNDLKSFLDSNNEVDYPPNMIATLFGMAFTHLRGIMAKNLAGSRFQHLYLPIITDPIELFNGLMDDLKTYKNLSSNIPIKAKHSKSKGDARKLY